MCRVFQLKLAVCASACLLAFCSNFRNEGLDPPPTQLYFPIAVALSPQQCASGPCSLYVVNSNFDLRYNAASVQALDLELVQTALDGCMDPPCDFPEYASVVRPGGEVFLGSYASDIAVAPAGDRFYVPIRSDANLTYVDVLPDLSLSCGGMGDRHQCSSDYERGQMASSNPRGVVMPRDPIAVIAGSLQDDLEVPGDGNFIVTGHGDGQVALFLEQIEGASGAPTLVDIDDGYPDGLTSLRYDTSTKTIYGTSRYEPLFAEGGVAIEPTMMDRSFIYSSGTRRYIGLDDGSDTRDVQVDAAARKAYVVSRLPSALVILDLARQAQLSQQVAVSAVVGLGFGPSRVEHAFFPQIGRTLVFVSCFDQPTLYIIDPQLERLTGTVAGFSGPFDLAIDVQRALIYVADFSSSVIRIVDLSQLMAGGGAHVIATVGEERPVKEIQ